MSYPYQNRTVRFAYLGQFQFLRRSDRLHRCVYPVAALWEKGFFFSLFPRVDFLGRLHLPSRSCTHVFEHGLLAHSVWKMMTGLVMVGPLQERIIRTNARQTRLLLLRDARCLRASPRASRGVLLQAWKKHLPSSEVPSFLRAQGG
jgi:hypothetical protein